MTAAELSLAQKAWEAYRSPDPHSLERLLAEDTSALPFLRGALELHLARYPSVRNGLGRAENKLLSLIAGGDTKFGSLCPAFFNAEPAYGLGDSQVRRDLKRVAEAAQPLIQLAGFDAKHGAPRLHAVCRVHPRPDRLDHQRQDSLSRRTIMIALSQLSAQIRLASGQSGAQTPY